MIPGEGSSKMLCAECGLPVDPRTGHCSTCGVWSLDDTSMPQANRASSAGARATTGPGRPWTAAQEAPQQPWSTPQGAPQQPTYAKPPPAQDIPTSYASAAPPTPPIPGASSTYWPPPRASDRADLPAPKEEALQPETYVIPPPSAERPAAAPRAAPAPPFAAAPPPMAPPTAAFPPPTPAAPQPGPVPHSETQPFPGQHYGGQPYAGQSYAGQSYAPPPASRPSMDDLFAGKPPMNEPAASAPTVNDLFPSQPAASDPFAAFTESTESVDPFIDDLDATMVAPRRTRTSSWSLGLPGGGTEAVQGSLIVGRAATPLPTRPGARLLSIDDLTRSISKNHAVFTDDNGFLFIEDLDSMNGIIVTRSDGHVTDLIPGERLRLDHGSRVELGDVLLTIHRS